MNACKEYPCALCIRYKTQYSPHTCESTAWSVVRLYVHFCRVEGGIVKTFHQDLHICLTFCFSILFSATRFDFLVTLSFETWFWKGITPRYFTPLPVCLACRIAVLRLSLPMRSRGIFIWARACVKGVTPIGSKCLRNLVKSLMSSSMLE